MEIVVLLKQVASTETLISIADDGVSIKTDDVKFVMNPYDEYAVEEALRIKEAQGGTVTILSVGPDKTVEAVRTGLAMGADKGVLVNDREADNCDGLGIAKILTAALKDIPHDLIIAGQRAVDDDNYLVGAAVAEYLNIPHISMVIKQELSDGKIKCHKSVDGGIVVVESPLPALFTTQKGLNEPRYASLPGIMKAKKKPLDLKTLADIGVDVSSLAPVIKIESMKQPPERNGGTIIDGATVEEKVKTLVKALTEEKQVL